jgi:hypothetical protein
MPKATHSQRSLFDPWLAWRELSDSVREQALDVLTTLCVEIVDPPRLAEQASHNSSSAEPDSSSNPASSQHGVTSQ